MNITIVIDGVPYHQRRRRPQLRWAIGPVSEQIIQQGPGVNHVQIISDSQQLPISISAVDKKGAPASVQGVTFSSSDPAVATVEQDSTDPTKALVKGVLPGTAQINVSADADMGDAVKAITGTLDLTVVGGEAASLSISTGTPEEQADVPPAV